ncbi:MAG: RNA-binding transcriptional accessory protein, partial [Muribaculaceae bacterium]|nr:RNA-binding transcriptional accessory protein [Muribaculaceae bacterium]
MRIPSTDLPSIIGGEFNLARKYVNAVIKLLDDGATIPFIARYRKEATGGMDETAVHLIATRLEALREYLKRREYVVSVIKEAGALTSELADRIEATLDPIVLEDIYMPYKPRRRTRAEIARENGLEPLARQIMAQNLTDVAKAARKYAGKGKAVGSVEEAVAGAQDIMAEWMSENEKARALVRSKFARAAVISSSRVQKSEDSEGLYANYYEYSQPLRMCASHRYLAIRRGEEAGVLKVSIGIDDDEMIERLRRFFVKSDATEACENIVRVAVRDSYRRLIRPSIENEMASASKERADKAAIDLFADNVRQLLLAPPMFGRRVMGIDPGFRTGCKVVCLDEQGNLLANDVIYPTPPRNDFHGATYTVCSMVDMFGIDVIAIGNGTAGRETEKFLSQVRFPRPIQLVMVNEDGASVYSASEIAREEFPDFDVTVRGAVSIGRRLLDPLAELVKIDPKSIGVGQYQHAVD